VVSDSIKRNESTVPMLPCTSPEETLEFYQMLGFRPTWRQTKPYLYLAFEFSGFEIHFKDPPKGLDPAEERSGGCLIEVDSVAPYHAAFKEAMQQAYGKVLVKGRPRITRYRSGASRFTLIDPSGNSIVFIRRDEPEEPEYGGSKKLHGLAKALDNARIFRDFKNDDKSAARIIEAALRRYGNQATPVEKAKAIANLIEIYIALEVPERSERWLSDLRKVPLTETDRKLVEKEMVEPTLLSMWLIQK
jgi:catechol 2,3-dioxygenase-like lactoylglutathione lyase family enzyme